MNTWPLFKSTLFALIIFFLVDMVGQFFHLFHALRWFDMPMHFLGGFFVSIFVLAILTRHSRNFSYGQLLLWGIGVALIVGLLWELYELYFGITYLYSPDYLGDNGMDLIMDLTGGLVAVVYSYLKIRTSKSGASPSSKI